MLQGCAPDFLLLTWTSRPRADIGMNRDNAPSKGPTAENGVLNASHGLTAQTLQGFSAPPPVESSIAVEDAVENRSLYRVFVSHWF